MNPIYALLNAIFYRKPKPGSFQRLPFASRKRRAIRTVKAQLFDVSKEHASCNLKCTFNPPRHEKQKLHDRMAKLVERGHQLRGRLKLIESMTEPS